MMNTPITMNLRDWFAGMAMQGLITNGWNPEGVAEYAYEQADEMIKERHKDRSDGEV